MSRKHRSVRHMLATVLTLSLVLSCALPTALAAKKAPSLSKTAVTLLVGQSTTLKVKNGSGKVTWKSSNAKVVTVKNGKLTAKKKGSANVTAKVAKKTLKCKVTVESPALSKTKATLNAGDKLTLKLSGTKQKVTWKSSSTKVAAVSAKGAVTAKKAGSASITATVLGKKYTCKLTVEDPALSKTSATLTLGESLTLKVKGTTQKVQWTSSAPALVSVSAKGVVTAAEGSTGGTVTITAAVGSRRLTCDVKVVAPQPDPDPTPTVVPQSKPTVTLTRQMRTQYVDAAGNPSAAVDATPVNKVVTAATVTFQTLPTNLEELKQYESSLQDFETGRFVLFGLLAATFKTYDASVPRDTNQEMFKMLAYLADSPWQLADAYDGGGGGTINKPINRQFVDDRMRQGNKYKYAGDVFWDGSWWKTGYTVSAPYSITLEEFVYYYPQAATASTPEYYAIICRGEKYGETEDGKDVGNFSTMQRLDVTWSAKTGRWYVFDNAYWRGLLSDASIKRPDASSSW